MRLRLSDPKTGEYLHVSPATVDLQIFLAIKLAPHGVQCEIIPEAEPAKYGIASGRRFPDADIDRPPMTPIGEMLFRESLRLAAGRKDT